MRQGPLKSLLKSLCPLLCLCAPLLSACGGDSAPSDGQDVPADATPGDADVTISPPGDCYRPEAPTTPLDCPLMCEKVAACGRDEPSCLSECAGLTFMLSPEAGAEVERCFVDLPCNDHPAIFGAIGCIAAAREAPTFEPPAGNTTMCEAILARASDCGLMASLREQLETLCDLAGHALASPLVARARDCATESCESFTACLGASSCFWSDLLPDDADPIPDERDACMNSRDDTAIGTSDVLGAALTCVDGCADGSFWCAQDCVTDTSGMTGPCSTCFTLLGRCMRARCPAACVDPGSEACHACQTDEGCAADFRVCAGRPIPGGPEDNLDCNPQEQTEIRGEPMVENVAKCVLLCSDGRTCNEDCMEALVMVGARCTGCTGDLATCAGQSCEPACGDPDDLTPCFGCLADTTCFDDFSACSGVAVPPPEGASCLGAEDRATLTDGSAWAATLTCVVDCEGQASCLEACITGALSLTGGCEACLVALGGCVEGCGPACADPASAECAACFAGTTCGEGFVACAGAEAYVPPATGTASCADAVACAAACAGDQREACAAACVDGAEPAEIPLAREVSTCVSGPCAGGDPSCIATTCLDPWQRCHGLTPTLTCDTLDTCLGACASAACRAACFEQTLTSDDAEGLLTRDACVTRFCGATPSAACAELALQDPAFCAIEASQCADPSAAPPPYTCREASLCVGFCPDLDCANACLRPDFPQAERNDLAVWLSCLGDACEGEGDPDCYLDACWEPFVSCHSFPGQSLSCVGVFECQAACSGPSCGQGCLASASAPAVAAQVEDYLSCIRAACTDPFGQISEACETQAASPGGACHTAFTACTQP